MKKKLKKKPVHMHKRTDEDAIRIGELCNMLGHTKRIIEKLWTEIDLLNKSIKKLKKGRK